MYSDMGMSGPKSQVSGASLPLHYQGVPRHAASTQQTEYIKRHRGINAVPVSKDVVPAALA
jgi:hypothetical protein